MKLLFEIMGIIIVVLLIVIGVCMEVVLFFIGV
jgi:hypothetical protein